MSPDDNKHTDHDFASEAFLQHSKKLLDDSVDSLDAATLSRLNQARQKALTTPRKNLFLMTRTGAVFASFAVAALTAVLWTSLPQQATHKQPVQTQLAQQYEDIDMLAAETDLDLLEDLEFVSWLIEEDMTIDLDSDAELNDAG